MILRHIGASLHGCRLALLLAWLGPVASLADEGVRDTVATRERPEVDPTGLHAGGFLIYPKIAFAYLHDDNVLVNGSSGDGEGSYATQTSPEAAVRSNWSEHALNFLANASFGRFADFPNENYRDWLIATDGRLDLTPDVQLAAGTGARRGHILRTSPESTSNLDEPIIFRETSVFGHYTQAFGRFSADLETSVHRQNYHDALGLAGGMQVLIDEDDRDRTQRTTDLRLGYESFPGQEYYLLLKLDRRDYVRPDRFINVERSSDGESALLGMTFDLSGITFGELSAGYLRQDYRDPFPDIEKPLFGASVNWNVTRLSTVKLMVQREIGETTSSGFSGYVSTGALLGVDHELRRDVLVNLSLNRISDDFQGIGAAEREDTTYDFLAGLTWLINRNLRVSANYHRLKRQSDDNTLPPGVTNDYRKNIVLVQLEAQR